MNESHLDQNEADGPHPATRRIIAMNIENRGELEIFQRLIEGRTSGDDRIVCIAMSAPIGPDGGPDGGPDTLKSILEWSHRQIEGGGAVASWLISQQEDNRSMNDPQRTQANTHQKLTGLIQEARQEARQVTSEAGQDEDSPPKPYAFGVQTGISRMPESLQEAILTAGTLLGFQEEGISVQGSIRSFPEIFETPDGQMLAGYGNNIEVRIHIGSPGIPDITHLINQEEHQDIMGMLGTDWTNVENIPGLDTNMAGFGRINRN